MVNLEELTIENKRFYESPVMTIEIFDFADVIVTSGQNNEDPVKDAVYGSIDDGE